MKYAIITDSTSDLSTELRKEFDIDYVKMNITYGGKEYAASLDWEEYTPKSLYDLMRNGTRVKTTQVPLSEFERVFKAHLELGEDIIYIACSSALSGSINIAASYKDELLKSYPDRKIYLIDSLNSCFGEGLIAIKAAQLRKENKSIEETTMEIEATKLRFNQFCTTDTLTYLKQAGRVKASQAFFGNLIGVKPIIISDAAGQNVSIKKVKGRKNALLEIVAMAKEAIVDPQNQYVGVGHADMEVDAQFLVEEIKKQINPKGIYVGFIGPIVGASVGPGAVAIYVYGKEVTIKSE